MTINTLLTAAAAGAAAIALGCAGPEKADSAAVDSTARRAAAPAVMAQAPAVGGQRVAGGPSALVPGTPAGGLSQWIGEVRTGLAAVPELVKRDPAAAKNEALQLYVTRQEYIEIYYGLAGRAVKDAALAEAVTTAETRFHDLLKVLNPPDGRVAAAAVPGAVRELNEQYDRVLRRAKELGVDVERLEVAAGAGS